jgi:glutathione S-transferase
MVNVDLFAGDQFKPEFLALNPYHRVPLLDDGAVAVPESWIINEYLEDRYPCAASPAPRRRRARPRARARRLRQPLLLPPRLRSLDRAGDEAARARLGEPLPGAVAKAKEALPAVLERLDRELDGRDFFAGAFSLVDCEVIPFAAGLSDIDMEIPAQYPNLRRWLDRARARPSYRTAEVDSRFTAVLLRETAAAGQRSA